jgi:hypothetical protein
MQQVDKRVIDLSIFILMDEEEINESRLIEHAVTHRSK